MDQPLDSVRPKQFEEMYESNSVGISRGWRVLEKNPYHGGVVDIFWNRTFEKEI